MGTRILQAIRKYPKTVRFLGLLLVFILFVSINTIIQINYYAGRALPNTRIGELNVGGKTQGEIGHTLLHSSQSAKLKIDTGKSIHEVTYYEAGLSPDLAYMSHVAVLRPWWHLVIPAFILGNIHTYDQPYTYAIDPEKISELVNTINEMDGSAPTDAKIVFDSGTPEIVSAIPGNTFLATSIAGTVSRIPFKDGATISVNPALIEPTVLETSFEPVKKAAETLLAVPPRIVVNGNEITIPAETIASWITTTQTDSGYSLSYKSDAIQTYVNQLNEQYFIPSSAGSITLLDGAEVSRTNGQDGVGIDSTAAVQAIIEGLTQAQPLITLPTSKIGARLAVDRSYSNTNSGLRALLNDLVTEKGDYAISVQEIGGANRIADVKGDNVYVAASTYKLYLALQALRLNEAGALAFDSPFAGVTVDSCFDLMIHHSDNYCANQFIQLFGRQSLTDSMHALGFSNTEFGGDTIYTTSNDLNKFQIKLVTENNITPEHRDKLLELMKHQIYRNGIPSGARDSVVANKVGYVNGYRHDTGIVYGPRSTYALTVTSYGGNYPQIVDITKRIHAFMQQ